MSTDARPGDGHGRPDRAATGDVPPHRGAPLRSGAALVAVAAGLVAIVGALVLPFAPVVVSTPEVTWPPDPRDPAPTMLMLTAYEPVDLDVRFSCRAARAAAASSDGVVLSTMGPDSPDVDDEALTIVSRDGGVAIRSGGADLFSGQLPPRDCGMAVTGNATAMRVAIDGTVLTTTTPRPPEIDPDELPDSEPVPEPISPLPEVDVLRTSVPASPAYTPDDLAVRLTVDNAFDHSPAPLKVALIVTIIVALVVGAAAMCFLTFLVARTETHRTSGHVGTRLVRGVRRRLARRIGARPWGLRPRVVDVAVPAVLVAWLFLAPQTDDDGYYNAMAANVPFSGYVANYFQLYHQGYTPFSWPYYALSWWQDMVGSAPVMVRLPALLLGLATWFAARAFVASTPLVGLRTQQVWWAPALARLAVGAAFLAWWLPYDMGVRPEPVVAFFAVATLVAVAEGLERRRLAVLALAVGLAMFGLMAAPTGFVALAPLIAGAPAIGRHIRQRSAAWWAVAGRWVVVLAPIAVGALLGFADGAYRDFVRSREIFAPIQRAMNWYEELNRYNELLNTLTHFGSYARRAAVLLCLLALVWFVLLVVAARVREVVVPFRLPLAGWSAILAFVLLLPTPSKHTHHFGALAGLGAVLLALVLVAGPCLLAELDREARIPQAALLGVGLSALVVVTLSGWGRDIWPFNWGLGMPAYGDYPSVHGWDLNQPLWWVLGLGFLTAAVAVLAHLGAPRLRRLALGVAVPVLAVLFLLTYTGWTVGDHLRAVSRTATTWSPQVDAWRDPQGTRCGLAQQIDVLDSRGSRPLSPALLPGELPSPPLLSVDDPEAPPPDRRTKAFVPQAFFPRSPLPQDVPPGTPAWGSFLVPAAGANADARTGTFATDWFRLPTSPQSGVAVAVSGRAGDSADGADVSLRAEYGRQSTDGFLPVASVPVATESESTAWRTVALTHEEAPPPGAEVVRLVADDASTTTGGWLAFTAPMARPWMPLPQFLPADAAVGAAWQVGFYFPCRRQPRQEAGITEPAVMAIGYGPSADWALDDWWFDPTRGGLLGHAGREALDGEPSPLPIRVRDVGEEIDDVYVFDLRPSYPADGYQLTRRREIVSGLS